MVRVTMAVSTETATYFLGTHHDRCDVQARVTRVRSGYVRATQATACRLRWLTGDARGEVD